MEFAWLIPHLISGVFLYLLIRRFLDLKADWFWRVLLFLTLAGSSGMVIWVGDNNLLFTLPVFFAFCMLSTQGDVTGRIAVIFVFFCNIMSVCAIVDTYLIFFDSDIWYGVSTSFIRPIAWGMLWLILRKRLPGECPFLSVRLWRLVLGLALMPLCSLTATVLLGYRYTDNVTAQSLTFQLGIVLLPIVFLTSVVLMFTIAILSEHERLERAERLASMRELYYQDVQREHTQIRRLRHDMRNHLTTVEGLLNEGNTERAIKYLEGLTGHPAFGGNQRICENEAANVVFAAKKEHMERMGLRADIQACLPAAIPVSDMDLTALLGNAVDNAMEAAVKTEDKNIEVRCRTDKGLFMLSVKNGTVLKDLDLSTSKSNKATHGFGIPGIREIAERYGGSLDAGIRNGRFELVVWFPLRDDVLGGK